MTQSTGKTGRGVTIEITDGESPTNWVKIVNVSSISVTGRNGEEIDFTHLESDGGFREFQQGFKDAGTLNVNLQFSPDEPSHQLLNELWGSSEQIQWRINFGALGWAWYWLGVGFVQNPGDVEIGVDNPIGGQATIRVSGASDFEAIP